MSAEAVKRFYDSMPMNFDRWHDGTGFDLDALRDMTPEELAAVRVTLKSGRRTWRELEALAAIDSLTGTDEVRHALDKDDSPENQIKAANLLFESDKLDQADYEARLCQSIRRLGTHDAITTRVLLYAQGLPTDAVKQALLWASWNRTDAAFHSAALLIYLCGKSEDQLSFEHRPLLFDLQPSNSSLTRQAAFEKLCRLTGLELDTSQPY
ncbi:MAG: hypothetical protein JWM57_1396 [Phycisphaerales bacterium]|nr:hypothetical protein [Phycisphaerales bacterium]